MFVSIVEPYAVVVAQAVRPANSSAGAGLTFDDHTDVVPNDEFLA